MSGDHGHDERRLTIACALIAAFMVAEVVVAFLASSLALLADAGHMLTDAIALVMAIVALRLARRPAQGRWTFGYGPGRGAVRGRQRRDLAGRRGGRARSRRSSGSSYPGDVAGTPLVVVASVGLVVSPGRDAGALRRGPELAQHRRRLRARRDRRRMRSPRRSSPASSCSRPGAHRADPIAALFVVVLMSRAAWSLLRDSGHVLLEGRPANVDLDRAARASDGDVVRRRRARPARMDVRLAAAVGVGSCRRRRTRASPTVVRRSLLDELQGCLAGHFDVEHSTFQLEPASHRARSRRPP